MAAATKFCTKCKVTHPTALFYANKHTKDGLQGWCRMCAGEASKHNQGMKRVQMRELKELLDNSELGYRIAIQELKTKFQKAANDIAVKYHKNLAKIVFEFEFKGEDNGKVERKTEKRPTEFDVRSAES